MLACLICNQQVKKKKKTLVTFFTFLVRNMGHILNVVPLCRYECPMLVVTPHSVLFVLKKFVKAILILMIKIFF